MPDTSLSLLNAPFTVTVLERLAAAQDDPVLTEDVCLWVGEATIDQIIKKADLLPSIPTLEPADLWAPSGVVIYETGIPGTHLPIGGASLPESDTRIGAQQWWTTSRGMVIADYNVCTLESWYRKEEDGMPDPVASERSHASAGLDIVTLQMPRAAGEPDRYLDVGETESIGFATPGPWPLVMEPAPGQIHWGWGTRLQGTEKTLSEWVSALVFEGEEGKDGEYLRGEPSMTIASEQNEVPPSLVPAPLAQKYALFWTLMQTAAAPASYLPRRTRRSLERQQTKRKGVTPAGNLWVVDIPRSLPNPESTKGSGGKHSYRYPVRGHWRNQWYASIQENKPRWIEDHVRGPHSAPLFDARPEWTKDFPIYRLRLPPNGK